MKSLDIIIPAYKAHSLQETLECFKNIVSMSEPKIRVMVFRDGPSKEIDDIVSQYREFAYIRFNDNLGNIDLVSHWLRCIEYSNSEFIWIFGDDDIIDQAELKKTITQIISDRKSSVCFRLRVNRINDDAQIIRREEQYNIPTGRVIDGFACLNAKFSLGIDNVMPNFIFKRELIKNDVSFHKLDLAWMADDLLWFDIGQKYGITQLDSRVCWRIGEQNISGSKTYWRRKVKSMSRGCVYLLQKALRDYKFSFIYCLGYWYLKQLRNLVL